MEFHDYDCGSVHDWDGDGHAAPAVILAGVTAWTNNGKPLSIVVTVLALKDIGTYFTNEGLITHSREGADFSVESPNIPAGKMPHYPLRSR